MSKQKIPILLSIPQKILHQLVNMIGLVRIFHKPNECLHTAIETNSPFWTKVAIQRGADIHANYGRGLTALHLAAKMGKPQIVRLLVEECKANVNAIDDTGRTPLFLAFQRGNTKTARILIQEFHVNVNTVNQWGETPLHLAAKKGKLEKIQLLVKEYNMDVNFLDKFGETPLHYASKMGNIYALELLIKEFHANVNIKNKRGMTPLYLAAKKGFIQIVNFLLDLPAIKAYPGTGHDVAANHNAALQKAVELGELQTVNRLLCYHEVIESLTANNNAILRTARSHNKDSIIARLMEFESVRTHENHTIK